MNHWLIAVVLIPLASAVTASIVGRRSEGAVRLFLLFAAVAYAGAIYRLSVDVTAGAVVYRVGGWSAPLGIIMVADSLTILFLILLCAGHGVFLLHALAQERSARPAMWVLSQLLLTALSGIVVAGDLFNLFVFVELASVSSVGLITHKQRAQGAGAGFVYLLFASISGTLFLIAVMVIYAGVGTLTMADIAYRVHRMPTGAYRAATALIIASLGIKFGMIPFHFWQAPSYDAAGSSVAALLSGTGMKVYLYAFARLIMHTLRVPALLDGAGTVLLVFGAVNILVGHTIALVERDLKRLLAFSSVAHVGYILIGLAAAMDAPTIAPATAAAGALLLHVIFHSLMKATLFYAGRSLIDRVGESTLERLRGVAHAERVGFAAFVLASLALVGIPPTSGFFSKWRVAGEAYTAYGVAPVAIVAAGTVISMLYYARVLHLGLSHVAVPPGRRRAVRFSLGLVGVLSAATLALGFLGPRIEAGIARAAAALVDIDAYLGIIQGGL